MGDLFYIHTEKEVSDSHLVQSHADLEPAPEYVPLGRGKRSQRGGGNGAQTTEDYFFAEEAKELGFNGGFGANLKGKRSAKRKSRTKRRSEKLRRPSTAKEEDDEPMLDYAANLSDDASLASMSAFANSALLGGDDLDNGSSDDVEGGDAPTTTKRKHLWSFVKAGKGSFDESGGIAGETFEELMIARDREILRELGGFSRMRINETSSSTVNRGVAIPYNYGASISHPSVPPPTQEVTTEVATTNIGVRNVEERVDDALSSSSEVDEEYRDFLDLLYAKSSDDSSYDTDSDLDAKDPTRSSANKKKDNKESMDLPIEHTSSKQKRPQKIGKMFVGSRSSWSDHNHSGEDVDSKSASESDESFRDILNGTFTGTSKPDNSSATPEAAISKSRRRKELRELRSAKRESRKKRKEQLDVDADRNLEIVLNRSLPQRGSGKQVRREKLMAVAAHLPKRALSTSPQVRSLLEEQNRQFRKFVQDAIATLLDADDGRLSMSDLFLEPMPSPLRKLCRELAECYNLRVRTNGSKAHKLLVVSITAGSFVPPNSESLVENILGPLILKERQYRSTHLLDDDGIAKQKREDSSKSKRRGKKASDSGVRRSRSSQNGLSRDSSEPGKPRVGSVVGESAKPIGEDNVGHRMMLLMGWKPGSALGKPAASESDLANEGITHPVKVVIRDKRAGLGH
ncbi:hypothetical protein BJ742DRAFT_819091 [Cladochytrium replicatum]|nr:hypothetical protein BJ742DRAFT_819091 [Cladochytrium replicatum]